MGININAYLSFDGTAKEAMTFYQDVLGGELETLTFAVGGVPHEPQDADKLMHSQLRRADGTFLLMGADTPTGMELHPGNNFTVSLSGDDIPALTGYWERLSEGGTVQMPLSAAPWGDQFGMCIDRFGTNWMFNIAPAPAE